MNDNPLYKEVKNFKDKNSKKVSKYDVKETALIPAIIQDFDSGDILMLGFMNKESFMKSLQTGYTWFYSRERKCMWNKGKTSGNVQKIMRVYSDCDNDALVFKVKQTGAACHTGNKSCFFNEIVIDKSNNDEYSPVCDNLNYGNYSGIYSGIEDFNRDDSLLFLNDLYKIIADRISEKSEKSYTYKLHQKGIKEIVKKIGEESIEIILAATAQEKSQIVYEIADLLYHVLVLMFEKEVSLKEVMNELKSRHK